MVTIEQVDEFVNKNAKAAGIIEVDIKFYDSLRDLLDIAKREVFNDMLKLHREIYEDSDKETRWKNGASKLASIHLGPEKDRAPSKSEIQFQEPKLFGRDEDGFYEGEIEEVAISRRFKPADKLMIKNRQPYGWIFSLFTGYRQIGTFMTEPFEFREGDKVIVERKDGEIVRVFKDGSVA